MQKEQSGWLQDIVFFEEGEPLLDGEPGDLKFHVVTMPHAKFERDRHDLKCNLTISLLDALVGFSTEVRAVLFMFVEPQSFHRHAQHPNVHTLLVLFPTRYHSLMAHACSSSIWTDTR